MIIENTVEMLLDLEQVRKAFEEAEKAFDEGQPNPEDDVLDPSETVNWNQEIDEEQEDQAYYQEDPNDILEDDKISDSGDEDDYSNEEEEEDEFTSTLDEVDELIIFTENMKLFAVKDPSNYESLIAQINPVIQEKYKSLFPLADHRRNLLKQQEAERSS